jgi:hypothetical protein
MTAQHLLSYTDADGLTWEGLATRVGKAYGRAIYQISIPSDPFCNAPERVLPKLAWGLDGARAAVIDYYEAVELPEVGR